MTERFPYELRLPLAPYRFEWRDEAAVDASKHATDAYSEERYTHADGTTTVIRGSATPCSRVPPMIADVPRAAAAGEPSAIMAGVVPVRRWPAWPVPPPSVRRAPRPPSARRSAACTGTR